MGNSDGGGMLSALPPILGGLLAGMDTQGELILGTWLYGGGVDYGSTNHCGPIT